MKRHGPELRTYGLPDIITRDRKRFLHFIEHGYDPDARHFSPNLMTPAEAAELAAFILQHVGEQAASVLLSDLRRRALG